MERQEQNELVHALGMRMTQRVWGISTSILCSAAYFIAYNHNLAPYAGIYLEHNVPFFVGNIRLSVFQSS